MLAEVLVRARPRIVEEGVRDMKDAEARLRHQREAQDARGRGRRHLPRSGRRALRRGRPTRIEVIKWKELYDTLEDALDQCVDVGERRCRASP